jgi:FixJ family two-component response regulator
LDQSPIELTPCPAVRSLIKPPSNKPVMREKTKSSATPLICVVDDDASIAESTRYLVHSFGFQCKAFGSAAEFLSSRYVGQVACLILDIRMPEMDGLELQHRLAETSQRVPIVFVTAHANDGEEKRAIQGGAVAMLRKPVSEGLLFNAIQSALGCPKPKTNSGLSR